MPDGSRTQFGAGELQHCGVSSVSRSFLAARTRRSLALGIWSALLMADTVLVSRRLAGGFELVIPLVVSVLSTILVACASWGAWVVLRSTQPVLRDVQAIHHVPPVVSLLLTLAWVWAISDSVSPFALGLLIGIFALHGGAVLAWESFAFERRNAELARQENPGAAPLPGTELPPNSSVDMKSSRSVEVPPASWPSDDPREDFEESAEFEDEIVDDVTLWLSRRSVETGELVEGWARAEFAGGQREVTVHIAFCPPLSLVPSIEIEDLDGVGLQIRVAAAFPFGARLSVRRVDAVDEAQSYRVGFVATAVAVNRAA